MIKDDNIIVRHIYAGSIGKYWMYAATSCKTKIYELLNEKRGEHNISNDYFY